MENLDTLEVRIRSLESRKAIARAGFDRRIPSVTAVELIAVTAAGAAGSQLVTVTWSSPVSKDVAGYDVWVFGTSLVHDKPTLVAQVIDAPASFLVAPTDAGAIGVIIVSTRMKNGLTGDLNNSPSTTFAL